MERSMKNEISQVNSMTKNVFPQNSLLDIFIEVERVYFVLSILYAYLCQLYEMISINITLNIIKQTSTLCEQRWITKGLKKMLQSFSNVHIIWRSNKRKSCLYALNRVKGEIEPTMGKIYFPAVNIGFQSDSTMRNVAKLGRSGISI